MRFAQDTKAEALKRSPLFEGLSRKQLARIARVSDDLEVPAGTVLCEEGSRGREFFVIISGEATVARGGKLLATVGPGDFFGEIALLKQVRRTATIRTRTPCLLLVLSRAQFVELVLETPALRAQVERVAASRLAQFQT